MLVLYLSLFVVAVNGYKSGAPVVACDSMTPGHNVEAQVETGYYCSKDLQTLHI